MSTVTKFNHKDVLNRAVNILQSGPLPEGWRDCGEFCPWCAAAKAKGQLDDEFGIELDPASIFVEVPSDWPLVAARIALRKWNDIDVVTLTQETAVAILQEALTVEVGE